MKVQKDKSLQYLCGIDRISGSISYKEAIELQLDTSEVLLKELLRVSTMYRDSERITKVLKAQTFWRDKLKELN